MRTLRVGAAACVLGVLLSGCWLVGSPSATTVDGQWRLVSGALRGTPLPIVDGAEPTLDISGDEVGGRSACNLYGGTIELDGGRIAFGAMSMTEMACRDEVMAAEAAYLEALGVVDRYALDADALTLAGADVELRFILVPPIPDEELTGTTWRLDSLIEGDAVSSTAGDPALLRIEGGQVTGGTGCRSFYGEAIVDGARLTVTNLAATDNACSEELAAQDHHVLAILEAVTEVAVDGDRLTIMGTDGRGLVYRADASGS